MVHYDGGRLGSIGICSASETVEDALRDAKDWARNHPGDWSHDFYRKPTVAIRINYRNWITGERE